MSKLICVLVFSLISAVIGTRFAGLAGFSERLFPFLPRLAGAQERTSPVATSQLALVGVVPASAFPGCGKVPSGILFLMRAPTAASEGDDLITDNDVSQCSVSPLTPTPKRAGQLFLVVPLKEDGTLAEKPCATTQALSEDCELAPGSVLSAFPLV